MSYADAGQVLKDSAELYRPPRRQAPAQAAADFLRNDRDVWSAELAPMMIEPLNLLATRDYKGIVLVGPARSSKTFSLILGGICYIVTCSPGDALIVQMSMEAARDFSRGDLDKSIRHSPELAKRLSTRTRDDNTFDKFFKSGMMLKIGWPAVSQLSSKTLQYVFITDYDRPEARDNVDGEGPLWDLAIKRVETYMSRGKCLAESSPGEEFMDTSWVPLTPHEAPPVGGILSLYNRGTRARWYWPCLHCEKPFQAVPGIGAFRLPDFDECEKLVRRHDPMTLGEKFARIHCPHCGAEHTMADRTIMNPRAKWLHEGEKFAPDGEIIGQRRRSEIASFWVGGCAATYQRWDSMLAKYFQCVLNYTRTGDEQPLKAAVNTDFADAYIPRIAAKRRTSHALKERLEPLERGTVPAWCNFITTAVDVQSNRFECMTMGWTAGMRSVIIDRFTISTSNRDETVDRKAALDPASFVEDWEVLDAECCEREYVIEGTESTIKPVVTVCDSGGKDGVTIRAYEFWRKMRARNKGNRFQLVKGDTKLGAPRVVQSYPDVRNRKSRQSGARGDVPVWLLNVNVLKDGCSIDLARTEPGPGFVHLPDWVTVEMLEEWTAETRNEKGIWETVRQNVRNETGDLHVYNRAACILLQAERVNWERPPDWATVLGTRFAKSTSATPTQINVADIARMLNG